MDFETVEMVNRRNRIVEVMFDGKCFAFKPFEKRSVPKIIAYNIVNGTALQMSLATGVRSAHALGIVGDPVWPTDPLPGELAEQDPVELLDRQEEEALTETEAAVLKDGEKGPVVKEKKAKEKYEAKVTGIAEPVGSQMGGGGDSLVLGKEG